MSSRQTLHACRAMCGLNLQHYVESVKMTADHTLLTVHSKSSSTFH